MTRAHEDRTLWQSVTSAVASSRSWALIVWWYFSLLVLVVAWKYLSTGWGDLLKTAAAPASHGMLSRLVHVGDLSSQIFHVYRADVIQTFLIVVVLVFFGHVIARLRLSLLACASLSLAAFAAFAEWLALRETGLPLTYSNMMISLDWAREHPEVIPHVFPWSGIALVLGFGLLYGGIPAAMSSSWANRGSRQELFASVSCALTLLGACMLITAAVTHGPLLPTWSQTMSPTEGFWSSTIASLADFDTESPLNLPGESRDSVMQQYQRIAYPLGRAPSPALLSPHIGLKMPRHVVLIVLETAPRRYYPLTDDSSYSTFHAMSARSIVTTHHLTPRPVTLFAIYGMLTGTYPRPGAPIGGYGHFRNDGLASTLGARGYETTYIDSDRVDWDYQYRAELQQEGFHSILDTAGFRAPVGEDRFAAAVARERWSFTQAVSSVGAAQSRGNKSFVVVATTLGHFPWRASAAMTGATSGEKVHAIGRQLDSAVGTFLHGLDSLHLRDSVIVIVTGDHGLRYTSEFQSFGYPQQPVGDLEFNVPFMLYAPGLIKTRIELPYATSHVDIAPTVFYLLGIPTDSLLLNGENMLDSRLNDRATFLMNTGIYPIDGFEMKGHRFTRNLITNEAHVTPPLSPADRARYAWSDVRTRDLLSSANHVFNLTAAYFLTRGRVAAGPK